MRISTNEKHKHFTKKFVKKFAFFPKKVQMQWIWLEDYYVGYLWDSVNHTALKDLIGHFQAEHMRENPSTRFDEWKLQNTHGFDKSTHNWVKFKSNFNMLPENPEVSKWLEQNSPLALVMAEKLD